MKDVTSIDELKLRIGYGTSGNQEGISHTNHYNYTAPQDNITTAENGTEHIELAKILIPISNGKKLPR